MGQNVMVIIIIKPIRVKELLIKELDTYQKKAKVISVNLKAAENELEDFQVIYEF